MQKKSQFASFLCTLVFGPLGLMYASIWQAFVFCAIYFALGIAALASDFTAIDQSLATNGAEVLTSLGWFASLFWLIPIVTGAVIVIDHNENVTEHENEVERRHQEILGAIRGRSPSLQKY